jgi:dethiobiotin synthetase
VGGLLVPLSDGYDVRRLAREVGLPLVVVARPGLGTINHTLLTLEAARLSGLEVAGVVLTPWPPAPGALERSNLQTIACLGGVSVSTLAYVARAETALLERAGDSLPLERWFQLFRPGS